MLTFSYQRSFWRFPIPGVSYTQPFGIPCAHFKEKRRNQTVLIDPSSDQMIDFLQSLRSHCMESPSTTNWELSFQKNRNSALFIKARETKKIPKATTATKQQVHGGFRHGPIRNHTELVEERNGTIDLATHSG